MRILLVEDDEALLTVVSRSLKDSGHRVDIAKTLAGARYLWTVQPFDAVLLDLNLPLFAEAGSKMGSGLDALREARARGDQTPVLILTARSRVGERIAGLNAGADDYMTKPFELAEVEARLRALVRRAQKTDDRVQVGRLTLDRKTMNVYFGDKYLPLPNREFQLLWELMTPPGSVVSKKRMSEKLSDVDQVIGGNALEALVYRLRLQIEGAGASIRTLRGLGYVLEDGA
jgi:two-component system OmpR family response regulator